MKNENFWDEWTTIAIKKETKIKLYKILIKKRFYNYNEVINYLLEEVNSDD